ncbi:MAG: hypothetical protein IMZ66_12055, partial [Planctomycetes bacterium]|nr:hypothetical protein [Planctomycetota bacterium]
PEIYTAGSCNVAHFDGDGNPAPCPDALTVDEEPWQLTELTAQTSRDTVLLCVAGMVVIAALAYLAGRAS